MMKAAVVHAYGQAPRFEEFPEPTLAAGEQLVEVRAAALHQLVRALARGTHYHAHGALPMIPGVDGVGRLADGSRVYFGMVREPHGTMAERAAAQMLLPVPDALSDARCAALLNPALSSWLALRVRAELALGETVLVLGATGTSGTLAVQIAKHLGARVVAAGRNVAALEGLGADCIVRLDASDVKQQLAHAGPVDVVLDYVWGPPTELALEALATRGAKVRWVNVGETAGASVTLPAAALRSADLTLLGSGLGSVPFDRIGAEMPALLALTPSLRLELDEVPLRDVERVWDRQGGKRVVLVPG